MCSAIRKRLFWGGDGMFSLGPSHCTAVQSQHEKQKPLCHTVGLCNIPVTVLLAVSLTSPGLSLSICKGRAGTAVTMVSAQYGCCSELMQAKAFCSRCPHTTEEARGLFYKGTKHVLRASPLQPCHLPQAHLLYTRDGVTTPAFGGGGTHSLQQCWW